MYSSNSPLVRLVNVRKLYGSSEALKETSLDIHAGEFLSILGPSGCGKTTTLRMIAGFEEPSAGEIFLNGVLVNQVAPNNRDVSTVFQDYSLFPHMTVFENIAFGLRERKIANTIVTEKVEHMLELVQLPGYGSRRPQTLSGGQKQRVAIARSLVLSPKVLLLDEPLGALDLKLRKQMQIELKELQAKLGITFVYVTHDQDEALTMSNRIVVMNGGSIQQHGTPEEIYNQPRNRFVADFIGDTEFFNATITPGDAETDQAQTDCGLVMRVCSAKAEGKLGKSVVLMLRPEKVRVYDQPNAFTNEYAGRVESAIYHGSTTEYAVRLSNGSIIRAVVDPGSVQRTTGSSVLVGWDPESIRVLPAEDN